MGRSDDSTTRRSDELTALVVASSPAERRRLGAAVGPHVSARRNASTLNEARRLVEERAPAIVLVRGVLADGSGIELARELRDRVPATATIVVADDLNADGVLRAMRAGAADVVLAKARTAEIGERCREALDRLARARAHNERVLRLRRAWRGLNGTRHELSEQIGSLCNDLVDAYQELSDRMVRITIASEFQSIVRQELDVESLLRTALEFVLAKVGPTNAAVFLPASSEDFSLGAYVNYDCPRDTAEMLFEHLADTIAPRMTESEGVRLVTGQDDLCAFFGPEAHWLGEASALAFSCRHDEECLAVGLLFRDEHSPFDDEAVELIDTISRIFARQLGRVIHLHHRHLPREQWGLHGGQDDGYDDLDLAA